MFFAVISVAASIVSAEMMGRMWRGSAADRFWNHMIPPSWKDGSVGGHRPAADRVASELAYDVEDADKDGHLDQDRQATPEGVHLALLVELHYLFLLFLAVVRTGPGSSPSPASGPASPACS